MQNGLKLPHITNGIFVRELKNRFLCEVIVNGHKQRCYIPSSCRLDNFLSLDGKEILLISTKSLKATTQYSILAVPYKRNFILLNSNMANRLIEYNIKSRRFSFLGKRNVVKREYTIDNYKSDLYIEDTDTLIEVKSIITTDRHGLFPSIYSKRALNQLDYLLESLKNGRKVVYIIVSLNPYLSSIIADRNTAFYPKYVKCIDNGMTVLALSCRFNIYNEIEINRRLEIE
jgi:DNA-binding sugar fermentation-stimulating protein